MKLTPMQDKVMALLTQGMMPTEIAAKLGRSVNTISTHLTRIKARLGAHSTIHAAVLWLKKQ